VSLNEVLPGQNVHWVDDSLPRSHYAAVIVAVHNHETVDLYVFPTRNKEGTVICDVKADHSYLETPNAGSWHWVGRG